jgi:hypothetical protein
MSSDVKVFGKLVFDDAEELRSVAYEVDEDDEASREVKALIDEGVRTKKNVMTFAIHGALTNEANLWFQEWLDDVAEAAESGSLDTWQEGDGPDKFMRLHADFFFLSPERGVRQLCGTPRAGWS